MSCQHKHVLITGTSSGMGKATTAEALNAGWHVFAGDRADDSNAVDEVFGAGLRRHVQIDVTKPDQIARAAEVIAEHVGDRGLDALVNNAGIGIPGPLELMTVDDLRNSFEVDVFGHVAVTQAMLPLLRESRGRIVFIGSASDRTAIPFFGALTSAKAAIETINNTLRLELAPWGIDVVLIEPGLITTGADKTTKKLIDELIENLTPEQAALYDQMFETAVDKGYKAQISGSEPSVAAEAIMNALTVETPRAHYLVGKKSHVMAAVGLLPAKLQDTLKRKAFDLPKPGSAEE